ncbi:colicin-E7 [Escherichia coli H378]|nr:colicin-E7 [Escherichia coli H378]
MEMDVATTVAHITQVVTLMAALRGLVEMVGLLTAPDGVRKITHGVAVPVVVFTGEVAPAMAMVGGMVIPVVAATHP